MQFIYASLLFCLPFYFDYVFRKEKIFKVLGSKKSALFVLLMMLSTGCGIEKFFTYFEWDKNGLPLLIIFSMAAHLMVSGYEKQPFVWDPDNGDSW